MVFVRKVALTDEKGLITVTREQAVPKALGRGRAGWQRETTPWDGVDLTCRLL
ncbi:MAG: hypothetical protein PHV34_05045 [Verrucomicrobiae bacterium]|nr:hypothetical protein [Verrucomicrobiae bacterium]